MAHISSPEIQTTYNKYSVNFYGMTTDEKLEKQIAQKVISENQNRYKGWKCWKGIQYMRMNENGDLFKCAQDLGHNSFGNMYDGKLELPQIPEVCEYDHCFCLTNLKCIDKDKI